MHPGGERVRVAILADDLAGALDAAVRFRGAGDVAVLLDAGNVERIDAPVVAVDAASRDGDVQRARSLTHGAAVSLHRLGPLLTYKKMDSQLRGHFAHEIVEMLTAGWWGGALVAPALPEHGRTVRGGRLRQGDVIGPSLVSAFHDVPGAEYHGVGLEVVRRGHPGLGETLSSLRHNGHRVLACDAETGEDLDSLVRAALTVHELRDWLWCGSAGLAGALSRYLGMGVSSNPPRLPVPFLGVIGSPDPAARAQLRAAEQCGLPVLTLSRTQDVVLQRALLETAKRHLQRGVGCFLVAPPPGAAEGHVAAYGRRLADCASFLATTARPAALILSGGDTARAVCRTLGLWGLLVMGEMAPGVPISRALGPPHAKDLTVVTKAGSFGSPDLWCTLISGHDPGGE